MTSPSDDKKKLSEALITFIDALRQAYIDEHGENVILAVTPLTSWMGVGAKLVLCQQRYTVLGKLITYNTHWRLIAAKFAKDKTLIVRKDNESGGGKKAVIKDWLPILDQAVQNCRRSMYSFIAREINEALAHDLRQAGLNAHHTIGTENTFVISLSLNLNEAWKLHAVLNEHAREFLDWRTGAYISKAPPPAPTYEEQD
jgi:hypothetical protein